MQITPAINVPKTPNISPPFLKACGMAKIPEPRLLFIMCKTAPVVLKIDKKEIWKFVLNQFRLCILFFKL